MLQPRQPQPEFIAKIVWGGLTLSMAMYGIVLMVMEKLVTFSFPSAPSQIENLALAANALVLLSVYFYKFKVLSEKDPLKKFNFSIICWVINEWIVLMGFVAVFLSFGGNGFIYMTNLMVGIVGNMLTRPRD